MRTSRIPVMGTEAHLVVSDRTDPGAIIRAAERRLRELEARWTRFDANSELSRCSAAGGLPCVVSDETAELVERAVDGWTATAGRFDPTVLHAIVAAGYDRDLRDLPDLAARGDLEIDGAHPARGDRHSAPGCAEVRVDRRSGMVQLPPGVGLDPGGIGKGLAADLVATEAVAAGADSVMVSIGGDLRVAGNPPPAGWEIELDHLRGPAARVNLRAGAVATSSTLRRRWRTTGGDAHHIIDPRSGSPTRTGAVGCSVVAGEAWWAEVLASAVLVGWADPGRDSLLDELLVGAGAVVTLDDGSQRVLGELADAFAVDPLRHGAPADTAAAVMS